MSGFNAIGLIMNIPGSFIYSLIRDEEDNRLHDTGLNILEIGTITILLNCRIIIHYPYKEPKIFGINEMGVVVTLWCETNKYSVLMNDTKNDTKNDTNAIG